MSTCQAAWPRSTATRVTLAGLWTVEVEFDSAQAAQDFRPPAWFGAEVTDVDGWSNAALARHGRPDATSEQTADLRPLSSSRLTMPSGAEWFIVLAVVLVIFGGSQLPKLARNLGKAQKEFKDGLAEGQEEPSGPATGAAGPTPTPVRAAPAASGDGSVTADGRRVDPEFSR